MGLTIDKKEVNTLPTETFEGEIIVIDQPEQVSAAVNHLLEHSKLGFDTETRPAFRKGQVNKVALMQLSTTDVCYLFRLNKLGYPDELDNIICNPEIMKIGLSLRDDFDAIGGRSKRKPQNFVDLQPFVDKYGIEDNSLQKIYAIIFKKKIAKRQRLSNWEIKTLSPAQKNYAAIDAWACLRIYNYLVDKYGKL